MKTLQRAVDVAKTVGEWMLIAVGVILFFIVIFLAGGGPAIFYTPETVCTGEQWVTIPDKNTSVELLATQYFPDQHLDQNVVAGSIQGLNGSRTLVNTDNAKIPRECHREESP